MTTTNRHLATLLTAIALVAVAATAALAGGPIYIADPATKTPYAWHMSSWPGGAVPVYTDLGDLGRLSNDRADEITAAAFAEWTNVPSSSFVAQVAGDFASIGLPDIYCASATDCNVAQVVGAYNGGGIHVIYDTDGNVLKNFFGLSTSVLGLTGFDFVADTGNEILESFTVINGRAIQSTDPLGERFAGVFTHEFGHDLNLAHSQGNGAAVSYANAIGPRDCATPYSGAPAKDQVETMYPFINVGTTGTGAGMFTVDRMDDIAALSDIYPAPGWPASHGSIRGTLWAWRRAVVIDSGDESQMTGVNIIARNVADPFGDFTSHITGQYTKGELGSDGSFVLNGLTPGAEYVVYVDGLVQGAYSVPVPLILAGPEEYYNGAHESGNGLVDDRCEWSTLSPAAGTPIDIKIMFNRVKGSPEFYAIPAVGSIPTDMSDDGRIVVGQIGGSSYFRWTETGGVELLGGVASGGQAAISADGSVISGNARDVSGITGPAIWAGGTDWEMLPPLPGALPCGTTFGSSYDISGDGSTIVGLTYNTCSFFRAFKWTADSGLEALPNMATRGNRANAVNYDGSIIVGWDDFSGRAAVRWDNGAVSTISPDPANLFVGEATTITPDGRSIGGVSMRTTLGSAAWRWTESGGLEDLGVVSGQRAAGMADLSNDGKVGVGYTQIGFFDRYPTIWTPELGWSNFNAFLNAQGTYANDWILATNVTMSGNGQVVGGWATAHFASQTGYLVRMKRVVICHAPAGGLGDPRTIDVAFPDDLAAHLAHGDTVGICGHGGL